MEEPEDEGYRCNTNMRISCSGIHLVVSTFAWSLHVLPMLQGFTPGTPGFLPLSKDMSCRLIGISKLSGFFF